MDKKTLKALKASIKHWEENVAAEKPKDASANARDCALCKVFCHSNIECYRCPVKARTGNSQCTGTPYYVARDALYDWHDFPNSTEKKNEFRETAQAELDFLKSLLPEGEEVEREDG